MSTNRSNIKLDDLREPHRTYAEVIGVENMIKLSEHFPSVSIHIPTIGELLRKNKYEEIKKEFDGSNIKYLAIKYSVSERTIYRIIGDMLKTAKTKPLETQISLFDQ